MFHMHDNSKRLNLRSTKNLVFMTTLKLPGVATVSLVQIQMSTSQGQKERGWLCILLSRNRLHRVVQPVFAGVGF